MFNKRKLLFVDTFIRQFPNYAFHMFQVSRARFAGTQGVTEYNGITQEVRETAGEFALGILAAIAKS